MRNSIIALTLLGVVLLACGGGSDNNTARPEPVKPAVAVEPKKEITPLDLISKEKNIAGAVNVAKPFMGQSNGEITIGTGLFAIWSDKNLTWNMLSSMPETKQSIVMKDPPASYGHKICAPGTIVEIQKDSDFWVGGITNGNWTRIVRFIAVGSSGDLVGGSRAKFCGIVTGVESYANSGGGTTHAVKAVGMFDLPENKL